MKIKDAAALLNVTPLTLRNWDKKGLLVAYRHPMNKYRLYRVSDIQDLLTRIRQPTKVANHAAVAVTEPEIIELPAPAEPEPTPPQVQKLEVMFEDEV